MRMGSVVAGLELAAPAVAAENSGHRCWLGKAGRTSSATSTIIEQMF